TSYSNASVGWASGRYFVSRVVFIRTLANTGEPASLPRNSPICHCLVRIHNASRTSARSARSKLIVRGRASSRFQVVTDGNSRRESASRMSGTGSALGMAHRLHVLHHPVGGGENRRDRDPIQ